MRDIGLETVAFYDQNAVAFAAETGHVDMSSHHERFLRHVTPGGHILDAGCGVGRDAYAFAKRGFRVQGFDASAEMVRLARERVHGMAEIHQMLFGDVQWQSEFDGVWACASLLHVPAKDFPDVASRLANALKHKGALYMSFKLGTGERIAGGRRFRDHTEETLRAALIGLPVNAADVWTSEDARPNRQREQWINAVAVRQ